MTNAVKKEQVRQLFAKRFRQALTELGYSPNDQKAMKHLFGVSGQAARKWAEGQALPTPARLPHIAETLGVRRAWLWDGEEPMRPTCKIAEERSPYSSSQDVTISTEELTLIQHYRELTAKQREAIRNVISLLRES